jgi:mono/diheme cytochrome c family protein
MRRIGVLFLLPLLLAAGAPTAAAQTAEEGLKVFTAQKCTLCHSVAGKGNKNGALDDVGVKLTAAEIRQWILTPVEMAAKAKATRKPPMKAFTSLSSANVDALVAYLQTLKGAH